MVRTYNFEVYLGSAWLGTVEANDEEHANEVARRAFGLHIADMLQVRPQQSSVGRARLEADPLASS